MKLTWLTDIHLNFLEANGRVKFYDSVVTTHCDVVLISGDIAEAPLLINILKEMVEYIKKPIYFVLGNHDYYRGQVDKVRNDVCSLMETEKLLYWLPKSGLRAFTKEAVLLGQDGWADGRYGDYTNSSVILNDSRMIADLFQQNVIGKYSLLKKMQELADRDAKLLEDDLVTAIKQYHPKKIIVLTHVPPFKEACLYAGKISNDDFLPYFGSKATGDLLIEIARENPAVEFLVLCGHTHEKAHYQPADNLTIKVGKAKYYKPEVQEVIVI